MADDIKKLLGEHKDDITRHFDTVTEALKGEIQQVAEGVTQNTQQLERLEPMEETLGQVKVDVDAIKSTLDQVNLVELRQEVNDMKKRLEELEAKAR